MAGSYEQAVNVNCKWSVTVSLTRLCLTLIKNIRNDSTEHIRSVNINNC